MTARPQTDCVRHRDVPSNFAGFEKNKEFVTIL